MATSSASFGQFYLTPSATAVPPAEVTNDLPVITINRLISFLIALEPYLPSDTLFKTLPSPHFPFWSPFLSLLISPPPPSWTLLPLSLTLCPCGSFLGLSFSSLLMLDPLHGMAQLRPSSSNDPVLCHCQSFRWRCSAELPDISTRCPKETSASPSPDLNLLSSPRLLQTRSSSFSPVSVDDRLFHRLTSHLPLSFPAFPMSNHSPRKSRICILF